jgi:hypothetical protein
MNLDKQGHKMQTIQVPTIQTVCCPNCGSPAERSHFYRDFSKDLKAERTQPQQCIQTQCHHCDYLMVTCAQTGCVIEAYAPGIPFVTNSMALCR